MLTSEVETRAIYQHWENVMEVSLGSLMELVQRLGERVQALEDQLGNYNRNNNKPTSIDGTKNEPIVYIARSASRSLSAFTEDQSESSWQGNACPAGIKAAKFLLRYLLRLLARSMVG